MVSVAENNTIVVTAPKSRGLAVLLTFLFGPLGLLYCSVLGSLILIAVSIVLSALTFVIPGAWVLIAIAIWLASMVWALSAASDSKVHVAWPSSEQAEAIVAARDIDKPDEAEVVQRSSVKDRRGKPREVLHLRDGQLAVLTLSGWRGFGDISAVVAYFR